MYFSLAKMEIYGTGTFTEHIKSISLLLEVAAL